MEHFAYWTCVLVFTKPGSTIRCTQLWSLQGTPRVQSSQPNILTFWRSFRCYSSKPFLFYLTNTVGYLPPLFCLPGGRQKERTTFIRSESRQEEITILLNYSNDPVFSEWPIRSGLEIKILSVFLTCVSYVCVCVLQVTPFAPSLSDYRNNIRHIGRQLKQFVIVQCFPFSVTCRPTRENVTRGVLLSARGEQTTLETYAYLGG